MKGIWISLLVLNWVGHVFGASNTNVLPDLTNPSFTSFYTFLDDRISGNQIHFSELDSILAGNLESGLRPAINIQDDLEDIYALQQEYARNPKVQRAAEIFDAIGEAKLLEKLTGEQLLNLPVGISKTVGNNTFTVMIAAARLLPTHAVLEVYCRADLSDGHTLFFGADNIKFSSEGGIIGDASLGLFADFPLSKGTRKMAITLDKFLPRKDGNHTGTYITFDCDGFVEMKIDATLDISREWVLPCDSEGEPLEGEGRVQADFAVTLVDWDDLVVDLSLPSFVLTKVPDIGFHIHKAVIDLSDVRNATDFTAPPTFKFASLSGETIQVTDASPNRISIRKPIGLEKNPGDGTPATNEPENQEPDSLLINLWRGLFFKEIQIILPKTFGKGDKQRLTVGAENLYIDSRGVTGKFYLQNVLPYDVGKIQKWRFSIDEFNLQMVHSNVMGFTFQGRIGVPITDKTTPFQYFASANLAKKIYNFGVATVEETSFPLWKAGEVTLYPGSILSASVKNDQIIPKAHISGKMHIEVNPANTETNATLDIADIDFRNLLVTSEAPYLGLSNQGGSVTLLSGAALNNSFLSIEKAAIIPSGNQEVKFALGMNVELMSEEDGGVRTGGDVAVVGRMEEPDGLQEWTFKGLELRSMMVEIRIGKHVLISGEIEAFDRDPVYGNGFKGKLAGGFIGSGDSYKFNLSAGAIFGTAHPDKPEAYKYWFFDGFVSSENLSITLVPGVLNVNGFGGGAYHHMRMGKFNVAKLMDSEQVEPCSGVSYLPDPQVALGIKASVGLKGVSGSFNGVATLELAFTSSLTLADIMFYGKGEFIKSDRFPEVLSRMDKLTLPQSEAKVIDEAESRQEVHDKITAALFLRMDFVDGIEMHGAFSAYMAAANGAISGEGTIDLLLSPKQNKWHLYIGGYSDNSVINTNTQEVIPPVSASINYGAFSVTAGLYFLTGNDIPGAPPIHPRAAMYFGISTNADNRDILNTGGRSPATGSGFAFGAFAFFDFEHHKGHCRRCCFSKKEKYVHIWGGVGFDISLLKYNLETYCSESGDAPHGAQGWRAGGRLWAFVEVKGRWSGLGCCLRVPHVGVGLLLDGDLPNPSYFRAIIKFKIIGLTIKGRAKIGRECGPVYDNLAKN